MHPLEAAIRAALDSFDLELARSHLRTAMNDQPTAEIYYLASLAALNDQQRTMFLQKALDLDPFHAHAFALLHPPSAAAPVSAPPQAIPPVAPHDPSTATQTPSSLRLSIDQTIQIRSILNRVGYKHPHNSISQNYASALMAIGVNPLDLSNESVIAHCYVGKLGEAWARSVQFVVGGQSYVSAVGHLLITNQRLILIETGNFTFNTPRSGFAILFDAFQRVEPIEYSGYTRFAFYGAHGTGHLDMVFTSLRALFTATVQTINAVTDRQDHTRKGIVHYVDYRERQAATQSYIANHLAQSANVKQVLTHILLLLINGV